MVQMPMTTGSRLETATVEIATAKMTARPMAIKPMTRAVTVKIVKTVMTRALIVKKAMARVITPHRVVNPDGTITPLAIQAGKRILEIT